MNSLRARLSLGLGTFLVGLLVLQWGFLGLAVDALVEDELDDQLRQESEQLLASLQWNNGQLSIERSFLSSFYRQAFSGHYYTVIADDTVIHSRSLWDTRLPSEQKLVPGKALLSHPVSGPLGQHLRMRVAGYRKQGHDVTLVVARDVGELRNQRNEFHRNYLLLSLLGLVLVVLLQQWLIGRMLRPLKRTRKQMAKLERGEIQRLEVQRLPDELQPVITELNRLLKGMRERTRRSREAQGNLAHALKTRIAVLNQLAESSELRESPKLQSQILDVTSTMDSVVKRELQRARLAGVSTTGSLLQLPELILELSDTLKLIYQENPLTISVNVPEGLCFRGDREDISELLGNLLENACIWCHGRINISAGKHAGALRIQVEDNGPGCNAEHLSQLIQRGFRVDESRPGSGLGLAIAHDIVTGYGGQLTFGTSAQLGGLMVRISLPMEDSD